MVEERRCRTGLGIPLDIVSDVFPTSLGTVGMSRTIVIYRVIRPDLVTPPLLFRFCGFAAVTLNETKNNGSKDADDHAARYELRKYIRTVGVN